MTDGPAWGDAPAISDTASWGDGTIAPDEEIEVDAHPMDVGNGHYIKLDPAVFEAMLREQYVRDALRARGQKVADIANGMAITEGAVYTSIYMDTPGFTRPQVLVLPANYKAKVDDAAHATLMVAAAMVGSDPKIEEDEDAPGEEVTASEIARVVEEVGEEEI
jgi:hypothetical protein